MNKISEASDKIYHLERIGIKPGILIAGTKLKYEIDSLSNLSSKSSIGIENIKIKGYTLDIVFVDNEESCEVYGNKML